MGAGDARLSDSAMYTYIRTQETTLNTNYVNNGHIKRFLYTVVITLSSRKMLCLFQLPNEPNVTGTRINIGNQGCSYRGCGGRSSTQTLVPEGASGYTLYKVELYPFHTERINEVIAESNRVRPLCEQARKSDPGIKLSVPGYAAV